MSKHPIDLLIDRKIKLVQEIKEYLDNLTTGNYEHIEFEKDKNDVYWIGIDFEVDLCNIKISSIGFNFTVTEIYESAFLMPPTPINEIVEKYISERMFKEIKFMLYGPEEGEQVEEIYNIDEWIKKQRERYKPQV